MKKVDWARNNRTNRTRRGITTNPGPEAYHFPRFRNRDCEDCSVKWKRREQNFGTRICFPYGYYLYSSIHERETIRSHKVTHRTFYNPIYTTKHDILLTDWMETRRACEWHCRQHALSLLAGRRLLVSSQNLVLRGMRSFAESLGYTANTSSNVRSKL